MHNVKNVQRSLSSGKNWVPDVPGLGPVKNSHVAYEQMIIQIEEKWKIIRALKSLRDDHEHDME